MGPFVRPREKADWEIPEPLPITESQIEQVYQRLTNHRPYGYGFDVMDRMHGAMWVADERGTQGDHLVCTGVFNVGGCDWRSEWPDGRRLPNHDYDQLHLDQWNRHRAEMALRDGIPGLF